MSQLNTFLKVLRKVGYPNPSLTTYAKAVEYDLDKLFDNLIDEVGYDKANDFVWNALQSLSEGDRGIKVNLDDVNAPGAYAYVIISQSRIDLEESDNSALVSWSWGETRIANVDDEGNDDWKTIEEIWEDMDMGEWGDFDNFLDEIKEKFNDYVYKNCGFFIWFDHQV